MVTKLWLESWIVIGIQPQNEHMSINTDWYPIWQLDWQQLGILGPIYIYMINEVCIPILNNATLVEFILGKPSNLLTHVWHSTSFLELHQCQALQWILLNNTIYGCLEWNEMSPLRHRHNWSMKWLIFTDVSLTLLITSATWASKTRTISTK